MRDINNVNNKRGIRGNSSTKAIDRLIKELEISKSAYSGLSEISSASRMVSNSLPTSAIEGLRKQLGIPKPAYSGLSEISSASRMVSNSLPTSAIEGLRKQLGIPKSAYSGLSEISSVSRMYSESLSTSAVDRLRSQLGISKSVYNGLLEISLNCRKRFNNSATSNIDEIRKGLRSEKSSSKGILEFDKFSINGLIEESIEDNCSLSNNDLTLTVEESNEINNILSDFIINTDLNTRLDCIESTIYDLSVTIENKPDYYKVIICKVLEIILTISINFASNYIYDKTTDLQITNEIINDDVSIVNNVEDFTEEKCNVIGVIVEDGLNVRSSPNLEDNIIDNISYCGEVEVIDSKEEWTLVEYRINDSDLIRQGWVNNHYIYIKK